MKPSQETFMGINSGFKIPLIASLVLHVGVFVAFIFGLPFIKHDVPDYTVIPITIERVEIDKKTQTPEPAEPKPAPAKKMDAQTPPDLIKKPEPPKPEPEPEPIPEPEKPAPAPEVKKDIPPPEKPKEAPKKEKPEPKPEPEKEVTKTEKPKPTTDFSSILKNLAPDEDEKKDSPDPPQPDTASNDKGQSAPLGQKLSMSEMDAIQQHIYPCWNIPAGAKNAEDLIVTIKMDMNSDGTVQNARIEKNAKISGNSAYQAASESALRAVRNPRCSPLPLPMNKYNQWKTITIHFDPRGVL